MISDIPALADGDLQHVLGLTSGAAAVSTTALNMLAQPVLGKENLKALMQGEYDFTLGIKGYRWADDSIKSPTTAQLATAENWAKTATDNKDTAGVIVTFGAKAKTSGTK